MKTIHIFYNGNEANFPASNDWEKFTGQDSVRLFLACAESWRRQGWNVKRLSTATEFADGSELLGRESIQGFDFHPFDFKGRIAREGKWYPDSNWQLIAKARTLQPDADGEIWITTFDTFNFGFIPSNGQTFKIWDVNDTGCVSFQLEHFSMALFVARSAWLHRAAQILEDYDAEKLARIPGKYTSDETILRNYAEYAKAPLQVFPSNASARKFPIIHYARSTLKGAYEEIPAI